MKDALGERMKEQYEHRTRYLLPRRTYTVIRLDGKAFHTFTRNFNKPFDKHLMEIMQQTTISLCQEIQGTVLGYTQSDEISLLLTDFASPQTNAWYDGNVQKIVSISASIATLSFNNEVRKLTFKGDTGGELRKFFTKEYQHKTAFFDSRVFTIPDPTEIENYFIWRQQDCVRNSVQMAAQALYSQKELHGKNGSQLQEMMFQKGVNWNDYSASEKRGTAVIKEEYTVFNTNKTLVEQGPQAIRHRWVTCAETPSFTANREFLRSLIPRYENGIHSETSED